MPPAVSKAQFTWANTAYSHGEITKKVRDEYVEGGGLRQTPRPCRR